MVIFATCPDDDQGVSDARAWIKAHGITPDGARLVKRDGLVLVIDKGDTWRRLKQI
jgi:ribosomal protein L36